MKWFCLPEKTGAKPGLVPLAFSVLCGILETVDSGAESQALADDVPLTGRL